MKLISTARRVSLSLCLTLLGVAAGMGGCGGSATPDRRTLIDSRDNYDPRSLDPALSTDVPTGRAVSYLFDGLTRFTPRAQVMPDLATSWELAPDGVSYTFHLKRGVLFHDGAPFSASDVRHSWERVLDPKTRNPRWRPRPPSWPPAGPCPPSPTHRILVVGPVTRKCAASIFTGIANSTTPSWETSS